MKSIHVSKQHIDKYVLSTSLINKKYTKKLTPFPYFLDFLPHVHYVAARSLNFGRPSIPLCDIDWQMIWFRPEFLFSIYKHSNSIVSKIRMKN